MSSQAAERILVIKLSALGDFVLSLGAFEAIRHHHPEAEITLLTTRPYQALAEASGFFQTVWCDDRPGLLQPAAWLALGRRLRSGGFTRVYDLQRSDRSGSYFRLLGRPKPEWVGTVAGCSHRYQQPKDRVLHILDRQAEQLRLAGIDSVPPPSLDFLTGDRSRFGLEPPYALLVPGGAAHRPAKRWPAERFATLAKHLSAAAVTPVLLGAAAEAQDLKIIAEACPAARDLCGQTGLEDIALLARDAVVAIGNDTGPMHLIAVAGCPVVSLFSHDSEPAKISPSGGQVTILRKPQLSDLPLERVLEALPSSCKLERRPPPYSEIHD